MMSNEMNTYENYAAEMKKLASLPHNKVCGDCNMGRSVFSNSTIGTFVCSDCGTILRSMIPPHRIQSISLTNYSEKDYNHFRIHGNEMCRKIWLKYFDARNEYYSNKIDDMVRTQYLTDKYVKKRWLAKDEDFGNLKKEIAIQNVMDGITTPPARELSKNNVYTKYKEYLAPDHLRRPMSSVPNSRIGSLYDAKEKIDTPQGGFSDTQNVEYFDPFNENNKPITRKPINSEECIFTKDSFTAPSNNTKSENSLFNVTKNPTVNGLGITPGNKLPPSTKVEFRSASQMIPCQTTKSIFPYETNVNSATTFDPFLNPKSNQLNFAIKHSSNISQQNGSMNDAFGAASVTDWRKDSSSVIDKSAASTTMSHQRRDNQFNSSTNFNNTVFNPFDSRPELPNGTSHSNTHLNGPMNAVTNTHIIASIPTKSTDLFDQPIINNPFKPHNATTRSANLFSTGVGRSSSNSDIDLFTPSHTFDTTLNNQIFSTVEQHHNPSHKHHVSIPINLEATSFKSAQPTFEPTFDSFFPTSSNSIHAATVNRTFSKKLSATIADPFNVDSFHFNSNHECNNNIFNTPSECESGGNNHMPIQYPNSDPLNDNNGKHNNNPNYGALKDLSSKNDYNHNPLYTSELTEFDTLDAFEALGFSKLPVVNLKQEKKLTLSQMASKSSLDSVSRNIQ